MMANGGLIRYGASKNECGFPHSWSNPLFHSTLSIWAKGSLPQNGNPTTDEVEQPQNQDRISHNRRVGPNRASDRTLWKARAIVDDIFTTPVRGKQ